MEHLSPEVLARLVDEAPTQSESEHLDACGPCRAELEALGDQTSALSRLPDLRPPPEGWPALEERLLKEGMMRPGGTVSGRGGALMQAPRWLQAAAAMILLLAGGGVGFGLASLTDDPSQGVGMTPDTETLSGTPLASLASLDPGTLDRELTLEEAEELVRLTEEWYLAALVQYRERLQGESGPGVRGSDPLTRFAALEALMAASRAAMREAPTDPFLNGLLVNMSAEREATLRGIRASAPGQNWY